MYRRGNCLCSERLKNVAYQFMLNRDTRRTRNSLLLYQTDAQVLIFFTCLIAVEWKSSYIKN
ncbi:asl8536 (plasmid) [Nostoc sp. PCC 7120 = FACHB-418]|nr:asl8536 [Nostoc sp. PCC 7120 = FACHB-418]